MSGGVRKVSDGVGKVSNWVEKGSDGFGKVSVGVRKALEGVGKVLMVSGRENYFLQDRGQHLKKFLHKLAR